MNEIEKYVKPYESNYTTMVPTNFVIKMRTCKLWQLFRFIIINIKMLIVVRKSH